MKIQRIVVVTLVVLALLQSTRLAFAAPFTSSAASASTASTAVEHDDHAACKHADVAVERTQAHTSLVAQDSPTRVATCYNCSGSGDCWTCSGSGKSSGASCYICSGSGKCYYCSGKGSR